MASESKKRAREDEGGIFWVKRADRLEDDYEKVYLAIPTDGDSLKRAALAVLFPDRATVDLAVVKLFRVETCQITPTLDEERAALAAPRFPPELSIDPPMNGAHFLVKDRGGSSRPGASSSMEKWSHILSTAASASSIESQARGVASRILSDLQITLQDQASRWAKPVPAVLRYPLPFDSSCSTKPCVLLEGLESADPIGDSPPLREKVWEVLRLATHSTAKRTALLLLLGVSGAGKTKVAFDVGRKHALLIFVPVYEKGDAGSLTRPWNLLVKILAALQTQLTTSRATPASAAGHRHGSTPRDGDALPESTAAVAVIIVLLACYTEWVAMVCAAAARELDTRTSSGSAAAGAARTAVVDVNASLREVAVRAQRNGTAFDNVHDLFCVRLLDLIKRNGLAEGDQATLSFDVAMGALARAEALLPRQIAQAGSVSPDVLSDRLPTFVCIDEIGALLEHTKLDGLL